MTPETKTLLNAIAAALADDATPTKRAHGAEAAKTIHTLLSAVPGTPLAPPPQAPSPLGQMMQQLQSTPQSVVLDALIAKLSSYLPKEEAAEPVKGALNVPFVPLELLKGISHEP